MRTNTALAALLLIIGSILQVPASAHPNASSRLQLVVVDEANVPLAGTTVAVYTLDGTPGVTAKTDAAGKVVFPKLSDGMAQVVVKAVGYVAYIEKTILEPGENSQTVKMHSDRQVTSSDSPIAPRS
jgi:hypothetical protein